MSSISPSLSVTNQCPRRSADFHPSIWGDYFLRFSSESTEKQEEYTKMEEQVETLNDEVRKTLALPTRRPLEKLQLIDTIQRLGVSYHFELEIDHSLQQFYTSYTENNVITLEGDLHTLSLLFRLLRQHRFHISPDIFEKFMRDKNRNILGDSSSDDDVEGVLSLYEAAHLAIHGEDILDEALTFTSTYLSSIITKLSSYMATKVTYSLRRPLLKNPPRQRTWNFISTYEQYDSHDKILLALAKLDFNMLQFLYRNEVASLTQWWKELDFTTKLPYARDRLVECYYNWGLGAYFEPCYSWGRKLVTKVAYIITILDDTYDVYGTFEELQLCTRAFERLDMGCMEYLPEYMGLIYEAWFDLCQEITKETSKDGGRFCADLLIDSFKTNTHEYLEEAKWLKNKYTPTYEEYISVTEKSIGQQTVIMSAFIGMGSIATKDVFTRLSHLAKIMKASSVVWRLMDDVATNEFEQKRDHIASSIECYMKQHCVKKEEATKELMKMITSGWKDINQELLEAKVAKPLLITVLSLTCSVDVFYDDIDGYTNSAGLIKDKIKAMLVDPFPL